MKKLLIFADDYGLTPGINRAIESCVISGTVSNVAIIPTPVSAHGLIKLKEENQEVCLGIHLILPKKTESYLDSFIVQLKRYNKFIGADPKFISLHWSAKNDFPKRERIKIKLALNLLSNKFKIPQRNMENVNSLSLRAKSTLSATKEEFFNLLNSLVPGRNLLIVHPGSDPDNQLISSYPAALRVKETEILTSRSFKDELSKRDIVLTTFCKDFN